MTTRTIQGARQFRDISAAISVIESDDRTVDLSFASDYPVRRDFGIEVLEISETAIDLERMTKGAPVLLNHDHEDQIGVVESVRIEQGRALARVRFSRSARATEILDDIRDGIRSSVSVGYYIEQARAEQRDGEDVYIVTRWTPFEISIVSLPADPSVGVGRSIEGGDPLSFEVFEVQQQQTRGQPMSDAQTTANELEAAPAIVTNDNAIRSERQRIAEIRSVGRQHQLESLADEYIENGRSVSDFRSAVLDAIGSRAPTKTVASLDLTAKEASRFSLVRAINASMSGNWRGAEFERECSDEIAKRSGREARGFYLPNDLSFRTVTVASNGGMVGTDHLGGSFIDNLRAMSVAFQAGVTTLTGLRGDVSIPKKTGSASFYWLDENEGITPSDLTFGAVTLTPKTAGGSVGATRKMLKQSSPDIEALIMADLVRGAALFIDKAIFLGNPATDTASPRGIVYTSGVNTQLIAAAGAPTWAEVVGFETAIDADNALSGSLSWITTPAVKGTTKTTSKDTGSGRFLMEGDTLNGYRVACSSQLDANRIIFGNFADVIVGMWGALDVYVDQDGATAAVSTFVHQDIDVAVRHPESFCINTSV